MCQTCEGGWNEGSGLLLHCAPTWITLSSCRTIPCQGAVSYELLLDSLLFVSRHSTLTLKQGRRASYGAGSG